MIAKQPSDKVLATLYPLHIAIYKRKDGTKYILTYPVIYNEETKTYETITSVSEQIQYDLK